jgi:hypothetical protein
MAVFNVELTQSIGNLSAIQRPAGEYTISLSLSLSPLVDIAMAR